MILLLILLVIAAVCLGLIVVMVMGILTLVTGSPGGEVPLTPEPSEPFEPFETSGVLEVNPVEYTRRKKPSDEEKIKRLGCYRNGPLSVFKGFYAVLFTKHRGTYLSRDVSCVNGDGPPHHIKVTVMFPEILQDILVTRCIIFNEKDEYMSEVERYPQHHQRMIRGDIFGINQKIAI